MKIYFSANSILMLLLTLVCMALVIAGLNAVLKKTDRPGNRRRMVGITSIVIALWMMVLAVLSTNGFFADFSKLPPRPALAMLLPLPLVLLFAFSKRGTRFLQSVPRQWLV